MIGASQELMRLNYLYAKTVIDELVILLLQAFEEVRVAYCPELLVAAAEATEGAAVAMSQLMVLHRPL